MPKRAKRKQPTALKAVTAERAARLYRLLKLLASGAQTRTGLSRRLGLDIRGFYRDLELLRSSGIELPLEDGRYNLAEEAESAIARLPFPDPHLTLEEATQLAKGRSKAARKLRGQIAQIVGK